MAPRDLVIACSVIGALGGAMFGSLFSTPGYRTPWHGWESVFAIGIPTTVSATLLGLALANRALGRTAWTAVGQAIAFSFVAGGLNGVLVLATMAVAKGSPSLDLRVLAIASAACGFGMLCAIPFVPAIAAATVSAARVHARTGSMAEASQRRRIARTVAVSLAIAAALVPARHGPVSMTIAVSAFFVTLLLTAVDAFALGRVRALVTSCGWERAESEPEAATIVDFGIGSEIWFRRREDETYRSTSTARELRRGDPLLMRSVATDSLRGHAIAAAVAFAAVIVKLATA